MVGIFGNLCKHEVAAVGGILQIRSIAFSMCRKIFEIRQVGPRLMNEK